MNRTDRKRWAKLLDAPREAIEYRFAEAFLRYWDAVVGRERGLDGIPLLAVEFSFRADGKDWLFSNFTYALLGHWMACLGSIEGRSEPSPALIAAQQAYERTLSAARDAAFRARVPGARLVLEPTCALFVAAREVLGMGRDARLELAPGSEDEVPLPQVRRLTNKKAFSSWVESARRDGCDRAFMSFDRDRLIVVEPGSGSVDPVAHGFEEVALPKRAQVDEWWAWLREGSCVRVFVDDRNGVLLACMHHLWEARRAVLMPYACAREIDQEELRRLDPLDGGTPIEVEASIVGFATRRLDSSRREENAAE